MFEDTICAPSTAPVNAPIAIIRVSGPDSLGTARSIFSKPQVISPRKALYGSIFHEGRVIDDVVLVYYQAPGSFTGEDMLEIFCHGNQIIVRRILAILQSLNIRMAGPGEFSQRAFLNGKMDLTEAEAIHHVITARSQWEVNRAIDQMHGSMKALIADLREKVILLKADIEAGIDFSGEDIEFVTSDQALELSGSLMRDIAGLLHRCRDGDRLSAGFNITIAGRPNVGKSSIMNMILNQERAIVSDIPGTTRDLIRESIEIDGFQINLIDTAGIDEPGDEIERIGISLSRKKIAEASIVLMVIDGIRGLEEQDRAILEEIGDRRAIIIINKLDAAGGERMAAIESALGRPCVRLSAKTGAGLRDLEKAVGDILRGEFVDVDSTFIADMRVKNLLSEALESAGAVTELLRRQEPPEIVAFELQTLLDRLGGITGEITPDDVLGSIFSRFCIGK
jgi:tRNA modification GTPase